MAKQRFVNTYFWNDPFILRLGPDEKLLFLWALTNPQTDLCGAYEVAIEKIAFEVKLTEDRIEEIFARFESAGKMLYRNGWVLIKNFSKHQQGRSPKVQQGAKRALEACPAWVRDTLSVWSLGGIDSVLPKSDETVADKALPIDYTETSDILSVPRPRLRPDGQPDGQRECGADAPTPEPSRDSKTKRKASAITDPFPISEEMAAWAAANVPNVPYQLETEKMVDYYRNKEGKAALKIDWVAAWRNWMRNAVKFGGYEIPKPETRLPTIDEIEAQREAHRREWVKNSPKPPVINLGGSAQ